MSTTWILIANASQARIYQTHKPLLFNANGNAEDHIELVDEFTHDASRSKTGDLVSDRNGNYQVGPMGHGTYAETTDPKEVEADRFAKHLVAKLNSGRIAGIYDDLIIVANPHFRGLVNKHLTNQLTRLVSQTIDKDYTRFKGRELVHQLMEHL